MLQPHMMTVHTLGRLSVYVSVTQLQVLDSMFTQHITASSTFTIDANYQQSKKSKCISPV